MLEPQVSHCLIGMFVLLSDGRETVGTLLSTRILVVGVPSSQVQNWEEQRKQFIEVLFHEVSK